MGRSGADFLPAHGLRSSYDQAQRHLYHGGHKGAEAAFSRVAEKWDIDETTLSFEGHAMERGRNVELLDDEQLQQGRVSMEFVFQVLGRRFSTGPP